MGDACNSNNWEAAFSLCDTARQRVLCSSRLRHRQSDSPIAREAHSAMHASLVDNSIPSQASVSQQSTSTRTSSRPPSLNKKTLTSSKPRDDRPTSDDAVPPCSQRKQPNNPSRKNTWKRSRVCDDNVNSDVARPIWRSSLEKNRIPHSTDSHSEDGENADRHVRTTASTSTQASIVMCSQRSGQKMGKVQAETIIDAVFNFDELTAARLEADFFQCDALELAPKLLGKFLRRDEVVLQITEVEAYRPNDSACHGRFGVTPRTAPVFGPGGHAYVYLCYGLHIMLNIVADVKGVGAAVLIRACAPVAGMETIQSRRGISSNKPILLTGPGKIGQALGLTTDWSNHPLYTAGGLEVLDGPLPEKILVGPRVGVDYANPEDVAALWRFAIAGTPWISAPRNTLAPPQNSA